MSQSPEIYFHVGMGKTGTKYVQYRVFPLLKGVKYIQRTDYKKAKEIIAQGNHSKYLVSNEFDQQMEREVKSWAAVYPDTAPIIIFRRQDSWIASQYRRYLKNSYTYSFQEFLDLKNDTGYFKKADLEFSKNIDLLKKYFTRQPLVLLYDNLKSDPKNFALSIADFVGAELDVEQINLSRKHTSYNLKQLKVVQAVAKHIDLRKRRVTNNPVLHRLFLITLSAIRYPILYFAKLIPDKWIDSTPFISEKELEEVRLYFEQDWNKCVEYVSSTQ